MLKLEMRGIEVTFPGLSAPALAVERFSAPAGGRLVITGASGSGKSTFVNIITGLEKLRTGSVRWGDVELSELGESRRDRWRGAHVGLVMQDFFLFEGLSALDNILLPARLAGVADRDLVTRARALADFVGLKRPDQRVETMSRGEMQRVAVARAVLRKPGIIVADEPTASLDAESGAQVAELLFSLADQEKSTLVVVSHDPALTDRFERLIRLTAGRIEAVDRETSS